MSGHPPLDVNEFAAFFRAVNAREGRRDDPFPWQERLVRQVASHGWPSVLDLPTGTGKTAALDVAVFVLALDAGRKPRSAPLRIVYVVDRRTVVDQAYERARKIRNAIRDSNDDVVQRVRERLAHYTDEGVPLRTALLRGGISRDDLWARTPDQPLIAVSTVDQVGSRLLFRGYGISDSMKPIHAGLLGCDVLYLLDEVHLSQPFRETLTAIRDRYRAWAERRLPDPFVVVEMSATPGRAPATPFNLEEVDRRHPILSVRLQASKPALLVSTSAKGFSTEIEKHVLSMVARPGATVAVVVNRVSSARDLFERLRHVVPEDTSVHLVTGRIRPYDRDAIEQNLLRRIRAGRTRSADDQPVVVVATQTIEAGADFDFDGLVTEGASLDALRQRFGRLDRLGDLWRCRGECQPARGVVVVRTDALTDDPVYGDAIGHTWKWLQANATEQVVDFGIEAMVVPEDADELGLLAPKAHAPILLPSHLDAWVQTAPIPEPDPDVALWLHGPQRGLADVQIVWRADLSETLLTQAVDADKQAAAAAVEVVLSTVEALPPVSAEAMSVPFLAVKRWLEGQSEPESFDVEGAEQVDERTLETRRDVASRAALVWQGEQSALVHPRELRPGQTIVVPSSYGGISHGNWAPTSLTPVGDVAEFAALLHGRRPTLRLHEAVVRGLFGAEVEAPSPGSSDSEMLDDRAVVLEWLEHRQALAGDERLRSLLGQFLDDRKSIRVERLPLTTGEHADQYFVVTGRRRPPRSDEDSEVNDELTAEGLRSSLTGVEITLAHHLDGVASVTEGFADRVGLPSDLVADLRLAGEWHDAGKADLRFQRWLHGGSEFRALVQSEPLAKGTARFSSRHAVRLARERAGYPARGRHECTSLALMESAGEALTRRAHDWALVRHVGVSHHGHGRPFVPCVADPDPVDVTFARDGIRCVTSSAHGLARIDSGVADRFWQVVRTYGWWGSAWLEALLRLADHRQSEREQTTGTHNA